MSIENYISDLINSKDKLSKKNIPINTNTHISIQNPEESLENPDVMEKYHCAARIVNDALQQV